ncbi:MAG: UDP-N-acetylmuramoyl-tripeptide--D-alanyl-D-alanine ligase [Pseudomonadota bacterium]|jgi:UDP-N-acetylmuramoyl-tripeptide--D-alanyl-D-alanine ligase
MLTLHEAAAAINAEASGKDVTFAGVSTDSRTVGSGELFVALKGERFDGHQFIGRAAGQGAVAAMAAKPEGARLRAEYPDYPLLLVEDTCLALGALAAFWRGRFAALKLAAVTGSNGKTTVKEMLAAILREIAGGEGVLATQGNLNNDIGVPLTLLKLRPQHGFAVIEMGMNHPGEIAYLSGIARPDVALVNNAQPAHLAGLGGVEAVAQAKGEIFQGLKAEGLAVINADDDYAPLWRKLAAGHEVVDFGLEHEARVGADYRLHDFGAELRLKTPLGPIAVALQVPGQHNVRNALAATAAAVALGADSRAIATGLAGFAGVKGRLQRKKALHGAILVDDTYNANPASVRAAIDVLAAAPGQKILVLGDMGELGPGAAEWHAQIGAQAKAAGLDWLLALGELSAHAVRAFGAGARHFEDIEALLAEAENLLAPGVTMLVKGSRFMQMERVVKSFEE